MGDLNSRRGRIQGMDSRGSTQLIHADVPMAEMLTYANDLTSMTQGRGSFSMQQDHYDFVPGPDRGEDHPGGQARAQRRRRILAGIGRQQLCDEPSEATDADDALPELLLADVEVPVKELAEAQVQGVADAVCVEESDWTGNQR